MYGNLRRIAALTAVALVLLVVLGVSATSGASATSTTAAGSASAEWAYGASKSYSFGPTVWAGHYPWVRQGNLTIGFSVVLNQVPSPDNASVFQLTAVRTMGVLFSVDYCNPSCTSPAEYLDIYYHQWERSSSQVNLTDQGTVVEGTDSVPALAVLNSSTSLVANLTNTYRWSLPGTGALSGQLVTHSVGVYANVVSQSQVAFNSPFGLLPLSSLSSSPETWSSESSFNASGTSGVGYFGQEQSSAGSSWTLGPHTDQVAVTSAGSVFLNGSYAPGDDLGWDGSSYPAVHLVITGPFAVREGFILIPNSADLFTTSSEAWSDNETGTADASMTALDARASVDGHVGLVASSWQFASTSMNSLVSLQSVGGLVPVASSSDPVGTSAYTLQGQPESVTDAQKQGSCVTTGLGCPAGASTPAWRKLLGTVILGGVVAAVVASLLVVLLAERRRMPPPPYPNANLYPPGAATGPGSKAPAQRPGTPPTSPPDEDPLDHLW